MNSRKKLTKKDLWHDSHFLLFMPPTKILNHRFPACKTFRRTVVWHITQPIGYPALCMGCHGNNSLSSSWMEIVVEFPSAVNMTSESEEDRVRKTVSNSSSSRVSSEIETLIHCWAGGGPIELPEANVRRFEVTAKSEPAVRVEKEKE